MGKSVNPNLKFKSKQLKNLSHYIDGINRGDRYVLSESLTLIESQNSEQRSVGNEILAAVGSSDSKSRTIRIGITGSPGAGKSTFIEALGIELISQGLKVAVLAIDPSSTKSKGSVLGDKTRMAQLSLDDKAFVRPTATANILGGVARSTRESIALCEAAGYDVILIESVGVGQSETVLADLVDIYMLLLLPGGGDGVQGIKRGVVELADVVIINKYDGDRKLIADQSRRDFGASIRLFHHRLLRWQVPVLLTSATEKIGIKAVLETVSDFKRLAIEENSFFEYRQEQDRKWLVDQFRNHIVTKAEQLFRVEDTPDDNQGESIFETIAKARQAINQDFEEYLKIRKEKGAD